MRFKRLNLDQVRASYQPRPEAPDERLTVSRRAVLQLAGAATVSASPALKALEHLGTRVEVTGNRKRVAFSLDGQERWVIDIRRLAGSPSLAIERQDALVRVTLTGARYPGTDLPADLVAELRPGAIGMRLSLRLALGGFRGEMAAEKFLSGKSPMRSAVRLGKRTEAVAPGYSLLFGGRVRAEFRPGWTLRLEGRDVASLSTPTGRYLTDSMTIALLDPEHPSTMLMVPGQRSRITLRRGEHDWPLAALLPTQIKRSGSTPGGTLSGSFDTVHLELGVRGQTALVAEAAGEHAALYFEPDGTFLDIDGRPFRFALQEPRLVRVFGQRSDEMALLARFHSEPGWLRTEGFALEVGDGPAGEGGHPQGDAPTAAVAGGVPLFELLGKGSKTRLAYAPALLRIAAPVAGAITEPSAVKEGTRLEIVHSRVRPRRRQGVAHVRTHPDNPGLTDLTVQNLVVSLLRPQDLLVVSLEYTNMTLRTGGGKPPRLIPTTTIYGGPTMVARFPPQHVGEEAYSTEDGYSPGPAGSVQRRLAGPSRLAFSIPITVTEIPYTVEALLDWRGFTQNVAITALTSGRGSISQPAETETAIEAPYRLLLSPNEGAGWAHAKADVTNDGITELWHTRLGVQGTTGVDETGHQDLRTMRAIWSPDYTGGAAPDPYSAKKPPTPADPFVMSLDAHDRDNIVRLTSDLTIRGYTPKSVDVDRLMLSSLGAWMDVHGVWQDVDPTLGLKLDVVAWRHRMAMGRDTYVRVARRGYLFPFGLQATYVTVTERAPFDRNPRGQPVIDMALKQRHFVVVTQPERTYTAADYPPGWSEAKGGRKMPFTRLRTTTLVTPDLMDPNPKSKYDTGAIAAGSIIYNAGTKFAPNIVFLGDKGFWPTFNGPGGPTRVVFHLVGEDQNDETVEFSTPLIFVSSTVAYTPPNYELARVLNAYNTDVYKGSPTRIIPTFGQSVALAPRTKPAIDTALQTDSIEFSADLPPAGATPPGVAPFFPKMVRSNVHVPALKGLNLPANTSPTAPAGGPRALGPEDLLSVVYNGFYLDHGLDLRVDPANKGQMFADLEHPPKLAFGQKPADGQPVVTPGVGQPNMLITGLSATLGAVGSTSDPKAIANGAGNAALAAGKFNPSEVFKGLQDATILGGIHLTDLFGTTLITDPGQIPQLVTANLPDAIEYTYKWTTDQVKNVDQSFLHFFAEPKDNDGKQAELALTAVTHVPLPTLPTNGAALDPTYRIQGVLSSFKLNFDVLELPFKSLTFTIEKGKKLQVQADVGDVAFVGFLEFLQGIAAFMKAFDDPPYLDLQPDHVEAGYTLGIPNIPMGGATLQNIEVRAAIIIPFFGDPVQAAFDFGTREHPFLLTVYLLGGGGHFGLVASSKGLQLEVQIELGASVDIDLVIVEAAARVMLGIIVDWDVMNPENSKLIGFFDIAATVTLLGLLTVGIDIQFGLGYNPGAKKLAGYGELQLEVGVSLFHKTLTLGPVYKEFPVALKPPIKPPLLHSESRDFTRQVATSGGAIKDALTREDWKEYCQAFA